MSVLINPPSYLSMLKPYLNPTLAAYTHLPPTQPAKPFNNLCLIHPFSAPVLRLICPLHISAHLFQNLLWNLRDAGDNGSKGKRTRTMTCCSIAQGEYSWFGHHAVTLAGSCTRRLLEQLLDKRPQHQSAPATGSDLMHCASSKRNKEPVHHDTTYIMAHGPHDSHFDKFPKLETNCRTPCIGDWFTLHIGAVQDIKTTKTTYH